MSYAKVTKDNFNWQEILSSSNFLYTIAYCISDNRTCEFCDKFKIKDINKFNKFTKDEYDDDIFYSKPRVYTTMADINNDEKKEQILKIDSYKRTSIYPLNNTKLNFELEDLVYGEDLWLLSQEVAEKSISDMLMDLITISFDYNLQKKVTNIFNVAGHNDECDVVPFNSYLFYDIFEFDGKIYIKATSRRLANKSEIRVYLLENEKRQMKCRFIMWDENYVSNKQKH